MRYFSPLSSTHCRTLRRIKERFMLLIKFWPTWNYGGLHYDDHYLLFILLSCLQTTLKDWDPVVEENIQGYNRNFSKHLFLANRMTQQKDEAAWKSRLWNRSAWYKSIIKHKELNFYGWNGESYWLWGKIVEVIWIYLKQYIYLKYDPVLRPFWTKEICLNSKK